MTQTQARDPELWALAEERIDGEVERAAARGVDVTQVQRDAAAEAVYAQLEHQRDRQTSPAQTTSNGSSAPSLEPMGLPRLYELPAAEAVRLYPQSVAKLFPNDEWDAMTPAERKARVEARVKAPREDELCSACHDSGMVLTLATEVPEGRRYMLPLPGRSGTGRKGPVFRGVADQFVYAHCFRCPKATQRSRLLSGIGPHDLMACTFHTFATETLAQKSARTLAFTWAHEGDTHPFLILRGPWGTGKSHLAKAIAREMSEHGWPVLFVDAQELLDRIRGTFDDANQREDDVLEVFLTAGVLVIDDLGAERDTDWNDDRLYRLLNARYRGRRHTVITTNLGPAECRERWGERLWSRLNDVDVVRVVELTGTDYRTRSRA